MIDTARALSSRLADLLRRKHLAMADFVVALAEFDERKGWRALGYSGLFPYLLRELGLSKGMVGLIRFRGQCDYAACLSR